MDGIMKSSELDFDKDINIDDRNLFSECQRQPKIFKYWADVYSKSKRRLKLKKHNLEILKAEITDAMRKSPKRYGLSEHRVTEKAIEQKLLLNEEIQEKLRELIDAEYDQDILSYAVKSFEQRKDSLTLMVKLALSEWYSTPNLKTASNEEREKLHRVANRVIKVRVGDD